MKDIADHHGMGSILLCQFLFEKRRSEKSTTLYISISLSVLILWRCKNTGIFFLVSDPYCVGSNYLPPVIMINRYVSLSIEPGLLLHVTRFSKLRNVGY